MRSRQDLLVVIQVLGHGYQVILDIGEIEALFFFFFLVIDLVFSFFLLVLFLRRGILKMGIFEKEEKETISVSVIYSYLRVINGMMI